MIVKIYTIIERCSGELLESHYDFVMRFRYFGSMVFNWQTCARLSSMIIDKPIVISLQESFK